VHEDDTITDAERSRTRARRSRLRWWLRRLPRRANLHRYPVIRHFAAAARRRPYLWSFDLPGVRRAIYAGAVISFLPVFGLQLFVAFVAAILVRANLAVTCGLQLLTNPLTIGPVYYSTYRIGIWIIRTLELGEGRTPMGTRFNALILGGIVVGLGIGLALDIALRIAAWEAGILRERLRRAREAQSAADDRSTKAGRQPGR